LERRRRVFQLDRPCARHLACDARQQPRLHRKPGDRRIVLDDDLDIDGVAERGIGPGDGVGISLGRPRPTHPHPGPAPAPPRPPWAVVPAPTGTRPSTCFSTMSRTSARSGSVNLAPSLVTPRAVRPSTPAWIARSTTRRNEAASISVFPRNGVGRTEKTPCNL